jgi:hypothetical protein
VLIVGIKNTGIPCFEPAIIFIDKIYNGISLDFEVVKPFIKIS